MTAAWVVAVAIFLKNAWVTDDAYIVFRSIEHVFAGNGPVWNFHERVQAYTSPLWFLVLLPTRIVSADIYLNVILISLALWVVTVRNLRQIAPGNTAFAMAVLLCVASAGFADFTSSGLENVLAYALLTWFLLQIARLYRDNPMKEAATRALGSLCVAFGLLVITRHDLVLLVAPPAAYVVWDHRRLLSVRTWCVLGAAALLPLAAWTLFSLVYYGFPWPNTAYAKLNTGLDRAPLVVQGFRYVYVSLLQDPITPLTIVAGLVISLVARRPAYRFVGLGMVLNLFYVVWIGGDFMTGRFLSYSFLLATCLCVLELPKRTWSRLPAIACSVVVMYSVLHPHTPVTCWQPDPGHVRGLYGVRSQHDYYGRLTLSNYLFRPPRDGVRPDHRWARQGLDIRERDDLVQRRGAIGMRGYMAGPDRIIIDINALSDPLLARLPLRDLRRWRIGHFVREIPAGVPRARGGHRHQHAREPDRAAGSQ